MPYYFTNERRLLYSRTSQGSSDIPTDKMNRIVSAIAFATNQQRAILINVDGETIIVLHSDSRQASGKSASANEQANLTRKNLISELNEARIPLPATEG
jgi:hypothetical protein